MVQHLRFWMLVPPVSMLIEVSFQVGYIVVLCSGRGGGGRVFANLFHCQFAKRGKSFGTKLVYNRWKHFRHLFCLSLTRNCKRIGLGRRLHLWIGEMNNRAIVSEHVNLFDAWNWVNR